MSILKYIFSIVLIVLTAMPSPSQEKRVTGLRLGYDVAGLRYYLPESLGLDPGRREMEFSADMEVKKNIYPILEAGQSRFALAEESYDYTSRGAYFRAGVDRNFLKKLSATQYEMLFMGLRYGFSGFDQSAVNITVSDPYWGGVSGGEIPLTRAYAHWVEVTAGIRGELFRNFFVGWSFRGRIMLHQTGNENLTPIMIPGFGHYNGKRANLGFTYSIFYRIPLYKTEYETTKAESGK